MDGSRRRTLLSEGKSSVICEATIAYRVNQNSQVAMVHFLLQTSSTSYLKVMRYSKANKAGASSMAMHIFLQSNENSLAVAHCASVDAKLWRISERENTKERGFNLLCLIGSYQSRNLVRRDRHFSLACRQEGEELIGRDTSWSRPCYIYV